MTNTMINPNDFYMACREDFLTFVEFVFCTLSPQVTYDHNWHIEVMSDALMRTYRHEEQRLIVNMPPRMLKSIVMSVAYPAWVLGRNPGAEIMCISYGDELVKDLGNKCLALMQSPRYRMVFPNSRLHKKRQSAGHIGVIGGGKRLSIAAGGPITGRGADIIIIDDPLKASDARTKQREIINIWYDDNIYQRLNNKNTGVIIVVMQRLHLLDLTGHLLEKPEKWKHLIIPAIAEDDTKYELSDGGIYLRRDGEILHPNRESKKKLDEVKANQGSYVFAAQYQQRPESDQDSLIKNEWFVTQPVDTFPKNFPRIIVSWDTANKIDEHNDYSVGIVIGVYKKRYYILEVIRKKMAYPDLLNKIIEIRQKYKRSEILVEDCASGQNIIQSLRYKGIPVKSYKPQGDKFTRLSGVSGIIESGLVYLPKDAPWLGDFLLEVTRFPNSAHDDQADALSQGLKWLSENSHYDLYNNL